MSLLRDTDIKFSNNITQELLEMFEDSKEKLLVVQM